MKKWQKTPQWIVAKRLRRRQKRTGKKVSKVHRTVHRKWSR